MHYLQSELYDLIKSDSRIFEFLESGSLDGVWYWDLENLENEWMSPEFWRTLGYEPNEKKHLASEWQDMIFKDDLELAVENFTLHCQNPSHPYDQLVRYIHKDGHTIWIRCRGMAIRDDDGKPIRMLGAHNDVTAIMEAKAKLEAQEKLLSRVLNSSLDGVMAFKSIREEGGKIVDFEWTMCNDAAYEITGFEKGSLIGERLLEKMPGNKESGLFDTYVEVVERGESKRMEFFFDHDGIREWFENKSVKLDDGFVVTFSVITETKNIQERLELRVKEELKKRQEQEKLMMHQSKMATMGEMIGMIAHQWRQPLNLISLSLGTIELLVEDKDIDREKIKEKSEKAFGALEYMSETIEDFRSFYRKDEDEVEFGISEAVGEAVEFVKAQLSSHSINIAYEKDSELKIVGAKSQLKQMMLVLLQNAKDAIIEAKEQNLYDKSIEPKIDIYYSAKNGCVEIVVDDNGIGIDEGSKERLFEPYFTTKHPSVGTGIGLYMVQTIVERYFAGSIELQSKDRGARAILKVCHE